MAGFVYMQIISDKQVGATYLTALASVRNGFRTLLVMVSFALINKIGMLNLCLAYIALNGISIFFFREKYISYLDSKSPDDFKLSLTQSSKKSS